MREEMKETTQDTTILMMMFNWIFVRSWKIYRSIEAEKKRDHDVHLNIKICFNRDTFGGSEPTQYSQSYVSHPFLFFFICLILFSFVKCAAVRFFVAVLTRVELVVVV